MVDMNRDELLRKIREMRGAAYRAGAAGVNVERTDAGPFHREYHARVQELMDYIDEHLPEPPRGWNYV